MNTNDRSNPITAAITERSGARRRAMAKRAVALCGIALVGLSGVACMPVSPLPIGPVVPPPTQPAPAPTTTMPAAPPATVKARLAGVHNYAFALGDDLSGDAYGRLSRFDLVVVDGELAPAALVQSLTAHGTIVLGYLSVGSIESARSWSTQAAAYRLDFWPDWNEYFADVSQVGFRDLLTHTVAPAMMEKGFNGLFLDNTDMIGSHPAQTAGMVELVADLSTLTHGRGGVLFTQNGDDTVAPMLASLDGWNREDVSSTYDFGLARYVAQPAGSITAAQGTIRSIKAKGLFVTSADYVNTANTAAVSVAVVNACAAGAVPWVADIGLTVYPASPFHC